VAFRSIGVEVSPPAGLERETDQERGFGYIIEREREYRG